MNNHILTPLSLARYKFPQHRWATFHQLIQAHLLKLATGQLRHPDGRLCRNLMIWTPPQHAKSTITSALFPATILGLRPESKLLMLSYSADLIRGHSMIARDCVRDFGDLMPARPQMHRDRQSLQMWHTVQGGYVKSGSIQGSVTGSAADAVIIDDPFKNSEEAASVRVRDKVWNTYNSAVKTRLAPRGFTAIINTPWHPDDLCGRLLASEADNWMLLRLPALAEDEGDPLGRSAGEPLFPSKYPLEWYESLRRDYELNGQSHIWDALYQCHPTGDGTLRAFPDSYFGVHLCAHCLIDTRISRFRVLALDPSKSKTGKQGDYGAFADVTLGNDGHLYAQMHLHREPLPALYERAVAIVRAARDEGRPYSMLMIESNMFQEAVGLAIQEKLQAAGLAHGLAINLHQTTSEQSKHARIQVSLGPLLAQKRLHFIGDTTGNKLTIQQLKELPNGSHDDGPDALDLATQCLNLLLTGNKRPAPTVLRA